MSRFEGWRRDLSRGVTPPEVAQRENGDVPMPSDEFPPVIVDVLQALLDAGIKLGHARVQEMTLADMRSLEKGAAIQRLIDAKKYNSVTAAEKWVEEDEGFRTHRRAESDAVLARTIAESEWHVAKLRAQYLIARET